MRKFAWRLQRVLDIKITEERVKKEELLELIEKLVQAQREVMEQKKILENIIFDIAKKKFSSRLSEQELFLRYAATNNDLIKKLEHKTKCLESQQREKIAELSAVRKFRKSLEKLRAKAKAEFLQEQAKLEQKQLDEGATFSFARSLLQHAGAES